ncbi:lysozyme inhibitor LprI family protein [Pseudomonas gingeri]|uniref:DUF1311 domain-containing protein n=1 Tax=Pseudomonas gingeri TaxID=117681 RepID=A0A7Y7WSQ5_9PSED|nr:lysozyme inhibitor LprI family protein [Pseudomonas gingeri]NWB86888.1 DUF1311 domain-containing protein [Pseudomonas gingeri]
MVVSTICKKVLVFVLLGLGGCMSAFADNSPCTMPNGSLSSTQCKKEKLEALEKELDAGYQEALEKLPRSSKWDTRETKGQLERAQRAWRVYRDENCGYVGGLQGGSSRWVTTFADDCAIEETERRIDFLNLYLEAVDGVPKIY